MKIFALNQRGNKKENQDRIVVCDCTLNGGEFTRDIAGGLIGVLDGVGGIEGGGVASSFVAERLISEKDFSEELFFRINDELLDIAKDNVSLSAMATTFSGVYVGDKTRVINIGNSRTYLIQGKKYLKQLTRDDTTVNYLLSRGLVDNSDIENLNKTEITACFGGGDKNYFRPTFEVIDTPASPILITTDGVHDYVGIDDMEEIIDNNGINLNAVRALRDKAREMGSQDDISIVLCDKSK